MESKCIIKPVTGEGSGLKMLQAKETEEETGLLGEPDIQRHVFVVNGSGVNTQSTPAEQTEQVITDRPEQAWWS